MSEVPALPANQKYVHTDGREYGTRQLVLSMGFTPPFFSMYRTGKNGRKHPVLDRSITPIRIDFLPLRVDGLYRKRRREMWPLDDFQRIKDAAKPANAPHGFTIEETAKRLGLNPGGVWLRIKSGTLKASQQTVPVNVRRKTKHGRQAFVQFEKKWLIAPEDLETALSRDDATIALAEAARQSAIPKTVFDAAVRRPCPLLGGKKLQPKKEHKPNDDGRVWPQNCIDLTSYNDFVAKYRIAEGGRILRPDGYYLSPARAKRDFDLPLGKSTAAEFLLHRLRSKAPGLGRPPRTVEAAYVSGKNDQLTTGKCYHEDDLEILFRRIRPRPSPPAADLGTVRPTDTTGVTNGTGPCVILGGENEPAVVFGKTKRPLSPTAYRVIKALLRAWPAGLTKDKLAEQSQYSDPHKILAEISQDEDWREAICRPGRGYRGGYSIK
jgi:hypothetical protein